MRGTAQQNSERTGMAKTIVPNSIGTQFPTYDGFSDGRLRSYPAPVSGEQLLLTLISANSSNPAYTYLPWSASYLGAFRLPGDDYGPAPYNDLNYTHNPVIGMGSAANRIFVAGRDTGGTKNVRGFAEFSIPALVGGTSLSALNIAANTQVFRDALTGQPSAATSWSEGRVLSNFVVVNGMVVGTAYGYYTSTDTPVWVLDDATDITNANERGFFDISGRQVYGGWINEIPTEHQAALGGTHLIGFSMAGDRAILSKYSNGPSMAVIDLDGITSGSPPSNGSTISITPLMEFSQPNGLTPEASLGASGTAWTYMSGGEIGFIVPNTRTYMVIGTSGGHATGSTYWDPHPPWSDYKGYGPLSEEDEYNYYWMFDLDEILAAENLYDPRPYEHGVLLVAFDNGPGDNSLHKIGGVAFDKNTGRLYISLDRADNSQASESALPLVVAYDLSGITGP
jgi:hypothetical protein